MMWRGKEEKRKKKEKIGMSLFIREREREKRIKKVCEERVRGRWLKVYVM
jgi:hypothetical protein